MPVRRSTISNGRTRQLPASLRSSLGEFIGSSMCRSAIKSAQRCDETSINAAARKCPTPPRVVSAKPVRRRANSVPRPRLRARGAGGFRPPPRSERAPVRARGARRRGRTSRSAAPHERARPRCRARAGDRCLGHGHRRACAILLAVRRARAADERVSGREPRGDAHPGRPDDRGGWGWSGRREARSRTVGAAGEGAACARRVSGRSTLSRAVAGPRGAPSTLPGGRRGGVGSSSLSLDTTPGPIQVPTPLLLGHVMERILRHVRCPVLVVR